MASIMAASLMAPSYQTRVSDAPGPSTPEDTVGPLPNIKLIIPKNTFQFPKNGLPVNPSPHARTPSDPAIQMPPGIDWAETRRSPPLKQDGFPSHTGMQSHGVQSEPLPKHNMEKTSKSSSARQERSARRKQDRGTQTEEGLYRTSSDDDVACQQCSHCQQRRSQRQSTTDSSLPSSHASSPGLPPPAERPTSPTKKRSSVSFGKKFKIGVLSRTNTGNTLKKMKETSQKEEKRQSGSRKIDYEMVSPTDHWGAE